MKNPLFFPFTAEVLRNVPYIVLPSAEFDSTDNEWLNYIDNDGTANNADATTCETACTALDKKCNFYIFATVGGNPRCYFGNFARDASAANIVTGLDGNAIRTGINPNGVVKLKGGML